MNIAVTVSGEKGGLCMSDVSAQELDDGNWDEALVHIKGPLCQDDKEKVVELLCAKLLGQEQFSTCSVRT